MGGDEVFFIAVALAILVLLAFEDRIRERAARTDRPHWGITALLVAILALAPPFLVSAMGLALAFALGARRSSSLRHTSFKGLRRIPRGRS
jgi:hypothetical protein